MVKSPYRPTSDSYGDRCGMLVFSCIKHKAITSLWALLEKPFDNLHFLQNISQKIHSVWEYLWGTILMTRSGTFVYMRYASAVGLLPWEGEMGWSRTAFSIVTSRRSARISYMALVTAISYGSCDRHYLWLLWQTMVQLESSAGGSSSKSKDWSAEFSRQVLVLVPNHIHVYMSMVRT